jgi:hypothetical protein
MNRALFFLAALGATAPPMCVCSNACADDPINIEAGAIVGAGTQPSNHSDGAPSALAFGLGARGGVSLFGFYGGIEAMYYFGDSNGAAQAHSDLYGVDLGYTLTLPLITIRPLLGIGNFTETTPGVSTFALSGTRSTVYLQPGITVLLPLRTIYVGGDVNALVLTNLPDPGARDRSDFALTIHAQVGLRF